MLELRSESDIRALGLVWICCESCHQDDELGFGVTERKMPNGEWISVCCATPDEDAILASSPVPQEAE